MSGITLMIESRFDNLSLVGKAVNKLCTEFFSDKEVWSIELCVVEAVNNVIKHAYHGGENGRVLISLQFFGSEVVMEIKDTGSKIPSEILQEKDGRVFDFDPENRDSLPEGGMGLALIKMSMDEVSYSSHNGTNTLRLVKKAA